jgi:integrase
MAFRRVCALLAIVDIRLHDLWHTFATWLRQRGTELDVIAIQLGHRGLRMTKRYARIAGAQVRQAVNGLDSMLGASQEAEMSDVSHPVTATLSLAERSAPSD